MVDGLLLQLGVNKVHEASANASKTEQEEDQL